MEKFKKQLAAFISIVLIVGLFGTSVFAETTEVDVSGETPATAVNGAASTLELVDFDKVDAKEAVSLLLKLGLINGKVQADKKVAYEPDAKLTRAEIAKLVAKAVTLVSKEEIKGTKSFADIKGNWATDYIQYCADKGIIDGAGGAYNPDNNVTGLETAKMLLAAMGVEGLTGSDWAARTEAAANEKGLLKGTKAVNGTPVDRDDAAQLIYNALTISDGSSKLPQVIVVSETTEKASFTIGKNTLVTAPEFKLVTMVADGRETQMDAGTYNNVTLVVTDKLKTNPASFTGRGIEDYRAAIYVDKNGLNKSLSVTQAISGGTYTDTEASGIKIDSTGRNFKGIIVNGGEYTVKDSTINLIGKADGSDTSDFTGLGSAVAAFSNAKVTLDGVEINTEGVARTALFTDSGADTMITDSKFKVMGGTLYPGYVNTADQTKMVAPPWVLGITGNARGTNLMGNFSTATVVRTEATANQWGVLSTDSGSNMLLTVVDSVLTLLGEGQKDPYSTNYGSGYGTYIIGDAQEYFYGTTFNVGTYASILTGGKAVYASSKFDKPLDIYPLKQKLTGRTRTNSTGEEEEVYDIVKEDTPVFTGITGQGKITTINSDAFGFMAHNNGELVITDGTVVNTDNATFLIKAGDVQLTVEDGAQLNTKDGVILQMIDNDDSIVGVDFSQGAPNFNTDFYEKAGYPDIDYDIDVKTDGGNTVKFNATDVDLKGNLYNGTGYFGGGPGGGLQPADKLEVTLGKGATLTGTISATSVIHVDENGKQNTHFTINEYYYLGHVANKVHYNGGNDISVTIKDGAVWNVTDTGIITSLTVEDGCKINGTIKVDGREMTVADIIAKGGTVKGTIEVSKK
ncbi:S-layer homology domain-containing protein [Biomaibacter acetigenes]|nr:S-layer homology domain-containing protein [Biomaibacter acetigenes]